jgi:mRNA-degrading endonuclease RelE of RelBE toxin-antitoxin system
LKKNRRRYTPEARRLIRQLAPTIKVPIRSLVDELTTDPLIGKELREKLKGYRSARYSRYRVIYQYERQERLVTIHYVGTRRSVYRLFEELIHS